MFSFGVCEECAAHLAWVSKLLSLKRPLSNPGSLYGDQSALLFFVRFIRGWRNLALKIFD